MLNLGRILLGMMVLAISYATPVPNTPAARGAVWFMNYCAGCHRLQYMSWPRVMTDLALQPQAVLDVPPFHLTVFDLQADSGLSSADALQWFAKMPPDLANINRLRGSHWLTAYLLGFYRDPTRPYGVSNHMVMNVMMPNVLFPVQQQMTVQHFEGVVADIVSFLDYTADPTQGLRYKIGFWVVSFFGICCGVVGFFWWRKCKYNGEKI